MLSGTNFAGWHDFVLMVVVVLIHNCGLAFQYTLAAGTTIEDAQAFALRVIYVRVKADKGLKGLWLFVVVLYFLYPVVAAQGKRQSVRASVRRARHR